MKTREDLEKISKEKFCITGSFGRIRDDVFIDDIEQFIFETIIPEVLNSVMPEGENGPGFMNLIIKQKAKELYGIEL